MTFAAWISRKIFLAGRMRKNRPWRLLVYDGLQDDSEVISPAENKAGKVARGAKVLDENETATATKTELKSSRKQG